MIISPAGAPTARSAPSSRPAKHMPMCMSNCKQIGFKDLSENLCHGHFNCSVMALPVKRRYLGDAVYVAYKLMQQQRA